MALMYSIIFVTYVLGTHAVSICQDQSREACHRLAAIKPDMCRDNCTASLCPQTCGKCPLTCYSCDYVNHPSDCNQTTVCSDVTMFCIAAQTVTQSLEKKYQLGCSTYQICNNLYGVPSRIIPSAKRTVDLLGGCCASDLCNKYDEPDKVPASTIKPEHPVSTTQGYSPECHELDTITCRHLMTDGACSNPCVSKMCPQACGKCTLQCYYCQHINIPGNCSSRINCMNDKELCVTTETHINGFHAGYKLGCSSSQACNALITHGLDGTCCHENLCNGYYQPKVTPPPATTAPSNHRDVDKLGMPTACRSHDLPHCPTGFGREGDSCYHVTPARMTHQQAWAECNQRCSRLAVISSTEKNKNITRFLQGAGSEDDSYWLDGIHENSTWWWNSTKIPFSYTHFMNHNSPPDHLCVILGRAISETHQGAYLAEGYFWRGSDCEHKHAVLCECPLGNTP